VSGWTSNQSFGKLHGQAVQAAVLPDQRAARDLHDFAARKGFFKCRCCNGIRRIAISRHQQRAVDDKEIRVRRGEAPAFIDDRFGPWQREQAIRFSFERAQRGHFLRHSSQVIEVRIVRIVTGLIDDRIRRRESREGVDVCVGVIAFERAMIEPQYALLPQRFAQARRKRTAIEFRMPRVQAMPGAEQGAGAVGFDRTAFQREIDAFAPCIAEQALCEQCFDKAVVARRGELVAPCVEAEVEQVEAIRAAQRDRTGIAQPCIVVFDIHETHARKRDASGVQQSCGVLLQFIACDADDSGLEARDSGNQRDITGFDISKSRDPIGANVRPSQENRRLRRPWGQRY